jgi:hypothetical protein
MPPKRFRFLLYALLTCSFAISSCLVAREPHPANSALTTHEWGTFTSIAGREGRAVDWSPLTGSTDLPGFVEHFRNARFKLGLRGTVRMETPVLYFYSANKATVSVKVSFAQGVITEWYPHADDVQPKQGLFDGSLYHSFAGGSISWDSVNISPASRTEFPEESRENHYYAARMTSSAPLRVKSAAGEQQEKFLFYRGVSTFSLPISATLSGSRSVRVENLYQEAIPNTILFERRGDKVGYRIGGAIQDTTNVDSPELTGSVDDLARELEGMLVAQGLYQDEAHAMLETWRGSWFEEGSRLLYLVPASFVNRMLPLSIQPVPAQTVRVFVGRLELVTPATERAVQTAFEAHDTATLEKYGRFLEPILSTMIKNEPSPAKVRQLQAYLGVCYKSLVAQNIHPN